MGKVSRRRRSAKKSTFRAVDELHPRPDFPLETAVGRRVDHGATDRRIGRVERAIVQALGKREGLFWELEQLRSRREHELHEAFFEVGYGHGLAAGRATALRSWLPETSGAARRLADETRALAVSSGVPATDAAAALLETAWAFLLGPPSRRDPSVH